MQESTLGKNSTSWRITRWLCLFISVLALSACSGSSEPSARASYKVPSLDETMPGRAWNPMYDTEIRDASIRFLPEYRWEWLKAQCYQESRLIPTAVSKSGAMGLCQFMPATWREVSQTLRLRASVYNPRANAIAAAYYMGKLARKWSTPRPRLERLRLAQASYNGGFGTVLDAQRKCGNARDWRDIKPCVPYEETREYPERVAHWYYQMTGRRE